MFEKNLITNLGNILQKSKVSKICPLFISRFTSSPPWLRLPIPTSVISILGRCRPDYKIACFLRRSLSGAAPA